MVSYGSVLTFIDCLAFYPKASLRWNLGHTAQLVLTITNGWHIHGRPFSVYSEPS